MEEAYDHLSEFHQMKAFEIIEEFDQDDASSSSEEDQWQDVKGQKNKNAQKKEKKLEIKFSMENIVNAKPVE